MRANPEARPIAGGSDLLGWIKEDVQGTGEPRWNLLVDIRTIPGSDEIRFDEADGLTLGPLATLDAIEHSPEVQDRYPVLSRAAGAAASPNIRHVGTIGGNINQRPRCWYLRNTEFDCYKKGGNFCFAVTGKNEYHAILNGELCYIVHPSDAAPALMALHADATIRTADGEQTMPFDEYFIGPRQDVLRENVLQQGDLLTRIHMPTPSPNAGMSFIKAQRRGETYDFAVVNVATVIVHEGDQIEDASIVLSGVAPTPFRAVAAEDALRGQTVSDGLLQQAAGAALLRARPMTENAYKVGISKNLIVRSVREAMA
ncbi:MAG: xanthine dehydrogenase family protein subunit M [Dehalococcoidia bacterium]|nr:xanthine dehydrogenase family protein subunit M [Dehalococcoidia bacterium]